jgi:hypothetical protein
MSSLVVSHLDTSMFCHVRRVTGSTQEPIEIALPTFPERIPSFHRNAALTVHRVAKIVAGYWPAG